LPGAATSLRNMLLLTARILVEAEMKPGERIYNKATDKQWRSEVYHKAKEVIEKVLSATKDVIQFDSICEATRREHPSLCDDTIKDPGNPQWPYWKHIVASAVQTLKTQGKVTKADNGWVWEGVELVKLPDNGKEKIPRLTHDELVQKIKELGEMLGKVIKHEGPAEYKHDCVWKETRYANPRLVVEVCDKGNLDKDIASLIWAVRNWNANCILVLFEESDFHTAQKKLAQESQIYPIKAEDMIKFYSLLQTGNTQAIKSILSI
jgi:hypothetical protein